MVMHPNMRASVMHQNHTRQSCAGTEYGKWRVDLQFHQSNRYTVINPRFRISKVTCLGTCISAFETCICIWQSIFVIRTVTLNSKDPDPQGNLEEVRALHPAMSVITWIFSRKGVSVVF